MESTFVRNIISQLEIMLAKEDLEGVKNLLQTLSPEAKAILAKYCHDNNLQYCNYRQAIKLIPDKSYKGLVESVYRFQNSNLYSIRIAEARIDLLSQIFFQWLIKKGWPETKALNLVAIQELRMRLDLISKNSSWKNSDNISHCWEIVENLNTPNSAMLLGRSIKNRLTTRTLDFVSKDKKYRMRRLRPSHVLIEYVTSHSYPFSKKRRILKKWQKARKK